MKFYENSLFWKLILPMVGLFALFAVVVYAYVSSHSEGLAVDNALAGQLVWMMFGFALVIAVQVWLGYSMALAGRIQSISDAIDRHNKGQGILAKEFEI